MVKIIPFPDNKGFVYSPFVIIVLMLLGLSISLHFMETDTMDMDGIHREGQINQAVLDMEEMKSNVNTMALFSSYRAISENANITKEELEEEITENLDEYLGDYRAEEISTIEGNFSVHIETLPDNHFIIKTNKTPRACINASELILCSDLGIERLIDKKWTN
jgi:RNase P/RNase MRP subunit POP5